jgi:hypothetical protein
MTTSSLDPVHLNSIGIFPLLEESEEDFIKRAEKILTAAKKSENEDLIVDGLSYTLPSSERLSTEKQNLYSDKVKELYGFRANWVPAYFLNKGLPLLTGGMAVQFKKEENEDWMTFFQLKNVFKNKKKWFIYTAAEIVSHEMCHVARSNLNSIRYEESLAYQTSESGFRRIIGGALLKPSDNILFLLTILWMLICNLFFRNSAFFFTGLDILPLITVLFLGLYRNFSIRKELSICKSKFYEFFGEEYQQVLFRLSDDEISEIVKIDLQNLPEWWVKIPSFRGDLMRRIYKIKDVI